MKKIVGVEKEVNVQKLEEYGVKKGEYKELQNNENGKRKNREGRIEGITEEYEGGRKRWKILERRFETEEDIVKRERDGDVKRK